MAEIRMLQEKQQQLAAESARARRHAQGGDGAARRAGGGQPRRRSPIRSCSIEGITDTVRDAAREGRRHQRAAVDDDAGAGVAAPDHRVDAASRVAVATPRDRSGRRTRPAARRQPDPRRRRRRRRPAAERLAAADVRHGLRRLHRRPVRPGDRRVPDLHPKHFPGTATPTMRSSISGIRSTTPARPRKRSPRSAGDRGLPADRQRAGRVLQAGADLRSS